jgi:glycosyltransferase involved in cell wall biosynthesis
MNIAIHPLVSIALCTYNGEKFLKKQLDSILSQDYNNIEIIAVDDCSGDNTWDILQAYSRLDNRLKPYKNNQNIGYVRNFEKAISLCTGDFIALADQDDIWKKDKIKISVKFIKDCILVYHNSDFIDENDKRIGHSTMASRHRMYDGESCLPFILSNCISGHATLFKKELIQYILPLDGNYYHDRWISYVAFNIGKVKFINKVLVHYRQHRDSITDALGLRKNTVYRKKSKSLERLTIDFDWLNYCSNFKYNKESGLIKRAYTSLKNLKEGRNRLQSLIFIVKYFDLLFYIFDKPRSFFSKVNFARKLCFR